MQGSGKEKRQIPAGICRFGCLLQTALVGLDHLLDHLAADGAGLAAGQVAVVTLLQVDTDLGWCT